MVNGLGQAAGSERLRAAVRRTSWTGEDLRATAHRSVSGGGAGAAPGANVSLDQS